MNAHFEANTQTEVDIQTKLLWTTPTVTLFVKDVDQLTLDLERIILKEESILRSRKAGTPVAGLESGLSTHWLEYNLLNWDYPEIAIFRNYVMMGIREFIKLIGDPDDPKFSIAGISCWANVLRNGESLHVHHHDPSFVSAHFLVKTGYEDEQVGGPYDSGHTIYYRPGFIDRSHGGQASAAPSPWDDDWQVSAKPTPGKLFLFPSYVRHEVRPYFGHSHRISIAMDVFLKMQVLPIYFGGARWHVPSISRQVPRRLR